MHIKQVGVHSNAHHEIGRTQWTISEVIVKLHTGPGKCRPRSHFAFESSPVSDTVSYVSSSHSADNNSKHAVAPYCSQNMPHPSPHPRQNAKTIDSAQIQPYKRCSPTCSPSNKLLVCGKHDTQYLKQCAVTRT